MRLRSIQRPVSGKAEGGDGSSERPDVGERDRDLDAGLDLI